MYVQMQMDGMYSRSIEVVSIILLLGSILPLLSYTTSSIIPPTLYVGEGEEYTNIQAAIDDASDGYRIIVYNGTYYENLFITKNIDLFGEDSSKTKIIGNNSSTIHIINAIVNISHFTIENNDTNNDAALVYIENGSVIITDNTLTNGSHGIIIQNTSNYLIYDNKILNNSGDGIRIINSVMGSDKTVSLNTIKNNRNGIYLYKSENITISNNWLSENALHGIFLNKTCNHADITNNNINNNTGNGIYLNDYTDYSTISDNILLNNTESGIVLENCSYSQINENTINDNQNYGIMVVGSTNIISNNNIAYNSKSGVFLTADDNTSIHDNIIYSNSVSGLKLYNSTDDNIYSNEFYNNTPYGVYLDFFTKHNIIWNNFFHDNQVNAIDKNPHINEEDANQWSIPKTPGTNIIGGTYIAGNYWDDFDEISEGAVDGSVKDGIANGVYTIYGENKDESPLLDTVNPIISDINITPEAQIRGKKTNISVKVTDNVEVKSVYIIISSPNGSIYNFSMKHCGNNIYLYSSYFTTIGSYNVTILAHDPRNWKSLSGYSFIIYEGDPPKIKDNSQKIAISGKNFTFNVTVSSDYTSPSDLETWAICNQGNTSWNISLTNMGNGIFIGEIQLDKSIENLRYYFYVRNVWGDATTTDPTTVEVEDRIPPKIIVQRHGPSFDEFPNSYTFGVTVEDNSIISNVTIKYWYNDSEKMIATMDRKSGNYYEKTICPPISTSRIFCIISAYDISGNKNDTRKPISDPGGPYSGVVLGEITFNGTKSFDLDGNIINYNWDFGDGTHGNGSIVSHRYSSIGKYIVTLTVIDDDGNIGIATTYVIIKNSLKKEVSSSALLRIADLYKISLSKRFYGYDSDGDQIIDSFSDPNNKLKSIGYANINENTLFLISTDKDDIPEFLWDTSNDRIDHLSFERPSNEIYWENEREERAFIKVTVNKTSWIYLEVKDRYPNGRVTVIANDRVIPDSHIWRKNGNIYVLDDASVTYDFIFDDIYPNVTTPYFLPADGGIIDKNWTTIIIRYNVPVEINYAIFGDQHIEKYLKTYDNRNFTYTPPGYIENGTYTLLLYAEAIKGKSSVNASATYIFFRYADPPKENFFIKNWFLILIGGIIVFIGLIFTINRNYNMSNFIYLKTRKILPFFKTIIFGPLSVKIDIDNIKKAEFYVDGELKDTITTPPYIWSWNEKAFLKHTLETKIYDKNGNSFSSGEMSFYIFNPFEKQSP